MGYGSNFNVEVSAHIEDCKGIGAEWVNSILAEVPTANELLADLNTESWVKDKIQFVNLGFLKNYNEQELDYYGPHPHNIKLWWGEGRNGINENNKFCPFTIIEGISQKYPNAIFKIVDAGVYSGNYSHVEQVMFGGKVVASIATLEYQPIAS